MEVASVEGVTAWLTSLGLPQYNPKFIENEIDGEVLLSLSSEELRDDLLVCNLRHRRKILNEIRILRDQTGDGKPKPLPEHGRILDHLSNTRTYHSWIRVGVQLLGFSIVTLRLAPGFERRACSRRARATSLCVLC